MAVALPDLSRGGIVDLWRGFVLPLRALALVFSTPKLTGLTLAVAAVTVVTVAALVAGLWSAAPALVDWAWKAPETWWGVALHTLLTTAAFVIGLVGGANTLPLALAAPLMDPISMATERLLGHEVSGDGGIGRAVVEILRAMLNSLVRVAVLLLGQAVLLPLLLIPGVGSVAWSVLSWAWTAMWVCVAYLDIPMARHLYTFDHEASVLKRRPALCLGFGGAVALMLWVPLLNFFFVPVAVVGSTLLFRALVATGLLPPPAAPKA